MEDLSLHILDVAENAVRAGAGRVVVTLETRRADDLLILEVADDGCGMSPELLLRATDPFFTTKRGRRIGLGLSFLSQAAREAGGAMRVDSEPGKGTTVRAEFRLSHPDLKPIGDVAATIAALIAGNPTVRFVYNRRGEPGETVTFDSFDPSAGGRDACTAEREVETW